MPDEKKTGIRIPSNILTIIIAAVAVVGIFVGWGYKYAVLSGDIQHLKERVTTNENKYIAMESTRLDWIETVHKIEVHLENIDTRLKAIEK